MDFDESWIRLPVRPNDIDALGHVNNAVSLEYLEAGRRDWLDRQPLTRNNGVVAVVARVEVDFRAELPYGEVRVHTRLESPTAEEFLDDDLTFRAYFRQEILIADRPEPAIEALVVVAFLERVARTLVPMQESFSVGIP